MSRAQEKNLVKKLVIVLMTSILMTKTSEGAVTLKCISCIKYPVQFQKNQTNII